MQLISIPKQELTKEILFSKFNLTFGGEGKKIFLHLD